MATAKSSTKEAPSKMKSMATSEKGTAPRSAKTTAAKPASSDPADTKKKAGGTTSKPNTSTRDHDKIRQWTEKRGGVPAMVKGTGRKNDDAGILRIDFPGYSGEDSLKEISWDEFFAKFDESKLEFLYQEKTADGKMSRFNKFVSIN